jgi:hypothetical protein
MRSVSAIFKEMMPILPVSRARKHNPMTGPKKKDKAVDGGERKKTPSDPTKDAPFKVDPNSDDFAMPRNDLSEDEIKEQADRKR